VLVDRQANVQSTGSRMAAARGTGAAWLVAGAVFGAAALYVGLITLLFGLVPLGILASRVWRRAGLHRWTFVGGSLIGMALCALPLFVPALTNHDPNVRYSSSTIPTLVAALVLGAVGTAVVVVGSVRAR
jgi:hypothetical protein